jgi:hypothetical protein
MSRRPVLLVAVVLATLGTAIAAAPAAPAASQPSDAQIAKAGLLRLSDFPAGWKQSAHKDSKPTGIASCKPTEAATKRNKKYGAQAPDFSDSGTSFAHNTVYVFPKPAQAQGYLKAYQADSAPICLQKSVEKAFAKEKGTEVQVQPLDLSSQLQAGTVDDAVGYELLARVPQSGANPVDVYLVAVAVRTGRGVAGYTFQAQGQPPTEIDSVIDASLTRLQQGLG